MEQNVEKIFQVIYTTVISFLGDGQFLDAGIANKNLGWFKNQI